MITSLTFADGSNRKVPAVIRSRSPKIVAELATRMTWWMLRLQQKIQGEKLSGQVLAHRTGKLFGSVNALPVEQTGSELIGTVEGAGGPAWYGQVHETSGTFQVKEHMRRAGFDSKGNLVKLLTRSGAVRKGVATTKQHLVSAHTVTFPPRPFMTPSLAEISGEMIADLQKTAGTAVE